MFSFGSSFCNEILIANLAAWDFWLNVQYNLGDVRNVFEGLRICHYSAVGRILKASSLEDVLQSNPPLGTAVKGLYRQLRLIIS